MREYDIAYYDYDLPRELIAQRPSPDRSASRLMVVDRATGSMETAMFTDLLDFVPTSALFVANNSKVFPARLIGRRPTGGKVEFLMLTPPPLALERAQVDGESARVQAEGVFKASKRLKPGDTASFGDEQGSSRLDVVLGRELGYGRFEIELGWRGDLLHIFRMHGHMPLPPYISRPDEKGDATRYQTLHAAEDKEGSAAAPTAGLHFTPEFRDEISRSGRSWTELTLHVGYGTFSPVRADDIREHVMHKEYVEIGARAADMIAGADKRGEKVLAVGTTAVRALEGAIREDFGERGNARPFKGWTDIFIYPGYPFKGVDCLLTNFHLPRSSLLMMVSAFAGRDLVIQAYEQAVRSGFQFFSYGDAMLLV